MTERWVFGIWLEKMALSDEHLVAVDDVEVCVFSAVRLLPDPESGDQELRKVLATLTVEKLRWRSFQQGGHWILDMLSSEGYSDLKEFLENYTTGGST